LKYNVTICNPPPLTTAVTNFHLFCICLDKNFICFIVLVCTRCDKTQGRNQRNISEGAEVTFGNDYDVIDVQSTMMRPFCYDQLTN